MAGELILIVEDNPKNLKLIRDVLRYRGYATIEAETAEAGIELTGTERPSLILMDVNLPGIDGRAAVKALKANASLRDIPVVALTAFAMKGDREALLAEGFDGYIAKPIDVKEIARLVQGYLDRPSPTPH